MRTAAALAIFLLSAVSALAGETEASASGPERLAARVRPAVVRVLGLTRRSLPSSGVLVGNEGVVLSWGPPSSVGRKVVVAVPSGDRLVATVAARDDGTGALALLLDEKGPPGLSVSGDELTAGSPVVQGGHAFGTVRGGGGAAVGVGIVAQVRQRPAGLRYLLSNSVNPGEAGGALVDRRGLLAGLLLTSRDPDSGLSTAAPLSAFREALAIDGKLGRALAPALTEEETDWPVHDALRAAAGAVCPAVFSLLPSAEGGSALSAVLMDREGYALTTWKHLEGRTEFNAVFPDGTEVTARLLGEDERTGIALLKLEGEGLPEPVELVDAEPRLGSFVVAMGNPNGRDLASGCLLTMGIVGGLDRSASGQDQGRYAAIHTDAGVNRGNIGGPLVDLSGRVVGILSSLRGESLTGVGSNSGVGFAIPISSILRRLDRMKLGGKVAYVPGRLGIRISLDPVSGGGVAVLGIMPDGPAEKAGMAAGDVVITANDKPIGNHQDLRRIFSDFEAGQTIAVTVRRGEETLSLEATLIAK